MTIIEHLRHLGQMAGGSRLGGPGERMMCAWLREQPVPGASTFVTTGLSDHEFPSPDGHTVWEEILFAAYDRFSASAISSFLLSFLEFILRKHQCLLFGDVVGPTNPIIPGIPLTAVLADPPTCFIDSFAKYNETSPPTTLVWLIPLHAKEAELAHGKGWRELQKLIASSNPDLFDLLRPSLV